MGFDKQGMMTSNRMTSGFHWSFHLRMRELCSRTSGLSGSNELFIRFGGMVVRERRSLTARREERGCSGTEFPCSEIVRERSSLPAKREAQIRSGTEFPHSEIDRERSSLTAKRMVGRGLESLNSERAVGLRWKQERYITFSISGLSHVALENISGNRLLFHDQNSRRMAPYPRNG